MGFDIVVMLADDSRLSRVKCRDGLPKEIVVIGASYSLLQGVQPVLIQELISNR